MKTSLTISHKEPSVDMTKNPHAKDAPKKKSPQDYSTICDVCFLRLPQNLAHRRSLRQLSASVDDKIKTSCQQTHQTFMKASSSMRLPEPVALAITSVVFRKWIIYLRNVPNSLIFVTQRRRERWREVSRCHDVELWHVFLQDIDAVHVR